MENKMKKINNGATECLVAKCLLQLSVSQLSGQATRCLESPSALRVQVPIETKCLVKPLSA